MENRTLHICAPMNKKISLKVIRGHFATCHSHINLYIDITSMKTRLSEANEAAKFIAKQYVHTTAIDTIVCLDGCEVIGTCLANELTVSGIRSMNAQKTIDIVPPEYNTHGQMIFRDNIQPSIYEKHILLLVGSATTGHSIKKSLDCISYYGGIVVGIHAIFSAIDNINETPINTIFKKKDLPEYESFKISECPHCKAKQKIDAMVDSYGYIRL
jgi:orotate phosphoribosyltransferase